MFVDKFNPETSRGYLSLIVFYLLLIIDEEVNEIWCERISIEWYKVSETLVNKMLNTKPTCIPVNCAP